MENRITVREALPGAETERFRARLLEYRRRDVFTLPDDAAHLEREGEYFAHMLRLRSREDGRSRFLFFERGGDDIGLALAVIYAGEEGKCFLTDFCVFPEHRGGGTGRECARALLAFARENGARYFELNCGGDARRLRFWQSVGFVENGVDEWGEPLLLLPPEDELPIAVEALRAEDEWQLLRLENGFRAAVGEGCLDRAGQERLLRAVREGRIAFFLAKRGRRAVGMCSVVLSFSTFGCAQTGVFDDFFVEPAFRGRGAARALARAAQDWCAARGASSLTACCASCDVGMYNSLGFDACLGTNYAKLL